MKKPLNLVNPKGRQTQGNTKPSPDYRDGLETIPEGSTTKRSEKGAALPYQEGDDIVRAASKGAGIVCNKCGVRQSKENFYDRNLVCKTCYKKRVALWQRREGKESHLAANRRWYRGHPGAHCYRTSPERRATRMVRYRKMMQEHPEKIRAMWTVNNMLRSGTLLKPEKCRICGASGRVEAHHPDYSRPIFVKRVCSTCHKAIGAKVATCV